MHVRVSLAEPSHLAQFNICASWPAVIETDRGIDGEWGEGEGETGGA